MKLRVVTYNIHKAIGVDRRFRPERIAKILRDHDAHVVLLQEVDEGVPRSRHLNLARELAAQAGYPHYSLSHNVQLKKGQYGNAILSRLPIHREGNIDLTIGWRKGRGCQHASLALDSAPSETRFLHIFNLHLGLSARERRQQTRLLIRSPGFEQLPQDSSCLVGGDFNDWRSQLRPLFVEELEFRCATDRTTKRGLRALRTYPSFSPRGALDRIYYRGGLELNKVYTCRHNASRLASDHLPVIAEFHLR